VPPFEAAQASSGEEPARVDPAHIPGPRDRPDTAAAAARQVVAALSQSPDGRIELHLDPAELGPVRVALSGEEGALAVHVAADRPETLDLFRRHAEILVRDLRAAGYGEVDLRFGPDTSGRDSRSGAGQGYGAPVTPAGSDAADGGAPAPPPGRPRSTPGTLDLRL
jgi:hypothetical protein